MPTLDQKEVPVLKNQLLRWFKQIQPILSEPKGLEFNVLVMQVNEYDQIAKDLQNRNCEILPFNATTPVIKRHILKLKNVGV
jgi:hypothetical protein